eukprot:m.33013 g.33013  ORF g.33013 m.33013 type:complete len:93 (+) comp16741_c0_seq1:160-438(+)
MMNAWQQKSTTAIEAVVSTTEAVTSTIATAIAIATTTLPHPQPLFWSQVHRVRLFNTEHSVKLIHVVDKIASKIGWGVRVGGQKVDALVLLD